MFHIESIFLLLVMAVRSIDAGGLRYSGATGTQLNRQAADALRYATHSNLPHLPFLNGYVGTHGTYRFLSVKEQTAVLIGDGKHGLWRVQENGFLRLYRKKGKIGLPPNVDPNAPATMMSNGYKDIIKHNYDVHLPSEGFSGYKRPDQKISDNSDGFPGYQNFLDVSIYHEKFGGKYNNHVPIDLPHFYCTMSQDDYPHMKSVWETVRAQPRANEIGPLARRAGFDIKEMFLNVVRLHFIPDGSVWINVGVGDSSDIKFKNLNEIRTKKMSVNFQRLDLTQMNYEIYFIERLFFNKPYLFITLIMENKVGPSKHTYMRPHGAYWDLVSKKHNLTGMNHQPPYFPPYPVENYPTAGSSSEQTAKGLPVYALHNPNRRAFGLTGGACPEKGGDYSTYPFGNPGAGWPTNYEEVGPICDAVLIDVKVWANLDKDWNSVDMFLANAAYDTKTMTYLADPNVYGKYEDPYLQGQTNPHMVDYTTDGKAAQPPADGKPPNPVSFKLEFARLGKHLNFNNVSAIWNSATSAPTQPPPPPPVMKTEYKQCEYQNEMLALSIAVFVLVVIVCIENIVFFIMISKKKDSKAEEVHPPTPAKEMGIDNNGLSKSSSA